MDGCPQGVVECELSEALFNRRRLRRGTAAHPSEACSGTSRDALLEASRLAF